MSLPPDEPKPPLTAAQRRERRDDALVAVRLRMLVGAELDQRGLTTPAAIGAALDLPPTEVADLLTRRQPDDGDVARLKAAAARLGLLLSDAPTDWPTGHSQQR